jgi:hypothetical protein
MTFPAEVARPEVVRRWPLVEVNTAARLGVHEGSEYIRMKLMPSGP